MRFFLFFLLCCSWSASGFAAANLIPQSGFEIPVVKGRTALDQGGDPSQDGKNPAWYSFKVDTTGSNATMSAGLTNAVSRTGKQSLYVDFNHVDQAYQSVILISNFIPVVSGTQYVVSIWGRTDSNDLIDSEGRSAYLKLEVDFFAKDGNQSVGDPIYAVQPLPGPKDHDAYFTPDGWHAFVVKIMSPPGAVFAQINWRWETGGDPGVINGIMYFDDPALTGPANANPHMTPEPVQLPPPDTGASPAAQ